MSWVLDELGEANLGDARRTQRLIRIVEDLAAKPNASVPQASRDKAAMQGMYDFWANRRVSPDAIISAHAQKTIERMSEHQTVLAIQDTTELDYSAHRSTQGLGGISKTRARGLKVHSVLATSAAGVPLGILHQEVWARPKVRKRDDRRRVLIEQKESMRWLRSLEVTQRLVRDQTRVITVCDREGDIYELFTQARSSGSEFLIRAAQNRQTTSVEADVDRTALFATVEAGVCRGQFRLKLQRTPRRGARTAVVSVRFTQLWLRPPEHLSELSPIAVTAILAEEMQPPLKETPIRWLLLTTLAVPDLAMARQCLRWYSFRWAIERYHLALKSGCRLESLQLKHSDRLERALACYAIVAWRLMWLAYGARVAPDATVTGVLERVEWQALYCHVHQTCTPPVRAPSLGLCIEWIGRLGGALGACAGLQSLWRGWQRLQDLTVMWQLLCE